MHIGEGTPGEVVVIRMRGAVADHPASVIRPLLLPDSPVVIWWPGKAPQRPGGRRAGPADAPPADRRRRRHPRPLAALKARAEAYSPGDTDLSWTRLTPWRALLAAALDQYPADRRPAPGSRPRRTTRRPSCSPPGCTPGCASTSTRRPARARHHRGADDAPQRGHRHHPAGRPAGRVRRARPARAAGRAEAPRHHRADLRGAAPDGRRPGLRADGQGAGGRRREHDRGTRRRSWCTRRPTRWPTR